MGVIRRFVWGTTALGLLAILGGTSALAFDGNGTDGTDAIGGEPVAGQEAGARPGETATEISAVSGPVPAPGTAWRWAAPHTIAAPTR